MNSTVSINKLYNNINTIPEETSENDNVDIKYFDYFTECNNEVERNYDEKFISKFSQNAHKHHCCDKQVNNNLVDFLVRLQCFINNNKKKCHDADNFLRDLSNIKATWLSEKKAQGDISEKKAPRDILAEWIKKNSDQILIFAEKDTDLMKRLSKIYKLFKIDTKERKNPIDELGAVSFQKFGNNLASQFIKPSSQAYTLDLNSNKMSQNKTSNTIIEKKFSLLDAKQEFFTDIKNLKKENPQYYTLRDKLEGKMFTLFKNCQSKDEALELFSEIAKDTDFVNLCQTDEIFASEALGKLYGPLEKDYQKGTTNPLMKDLFDKLKILDLLKKMQGSDNVGKYLKKEIANYLDSL